MSDLPRTPKAVVTDSPWFWLALFAAVGLGAIAAIGPKYLRREAGLEQKAAARAGAAQRAQETGTPLRESAPGEDVPQFRQPLRVGVVTLASVIAVVLVVSIVALIRQTRAAQ